MSFLTMAIAARELSDTLNPFQIVFMRTSVALVIVLAMVAHQGKAAIYTQRLPLHFFRNIIHYGANLSWIVGVGLIPLAQVFALEFSIPIWVALLAVVFLKEKMTIGKIVAIVLGFAGVLIILRPGLVSIDFGSLAVLAASLGFAISNVATKSLARQDSALTIIFLMFLHAMANWRNRRQYCLDNTRMGRCAVDRFDWRNCINCALHHDPRPYAGRCHSGHPD